MVIERGELWWVDLGFPRGSAPALRRPAVVVSGPPYLASRLSTATVVAVTSATHLGALPGNVVLPAGTTGLDRDSVANVTQVATVDRTAFEERIGVLPAWLLAQLDDGLRRALAL